MKSAAMKLLLMVLALGLGACASAPNELFVPEKWDDELIAHWTSRVEAQGLTGRLLATGRKVQSEADVLDAVRTAQKKIFGGSIGNLSINQFRKVGRSYVVCVGDLRGRCYFLARVGESGVMYYPVGTIAR